MTQTIVYDTSSSFITCRKW